MMRMTKMVKLWKCDGGAGGLILTTIADHSVQPLSHNLPLHIGKDPSQLHGQLMHFCLQMM